MYGFGKGINLIQKEEGEERKKEKRKGEQEEMGKTYIAFVKIK